MTLIELEEIKDSNIREEYYHRVTDLDSFERFKSIFEDLAGISPTLVGYKLFRPAGHEEPNRLVIKHTVDGMEYKLVGSFTHLEGSVDVNLVMNISEE